MPVRSFRDYRLSEDAPTNSVAGDGVAGLGAQPPSKPPGWGEPGLRRKPRILRRKKLSEEVQKGRFAGHDTFIVPHDMFLKARNAKKHGKHWKTYVGQNEHGMAIRDYARKNPKKPIIFQCDRTGALTYGRYGKTNPTYSLKEAEFLPYIKKKDKFDFQSGSHHLEDKNDKHWGKLNKDHHVIAHTAYGYTNVHVVRAKDNRITTSLSGKIRKGVYHIDSVESTGRGPKAHELYHHMIKHGHVKALVGYSHSEGGQKVWQRLAKKKNVTVHGWLRGKPVNLDPQDPEETHATARDAYGDAGKYAARRQDIDRGAVDTLNTSLVASYNPRKKK